MVWNTENSPLYRTVESFNSRSGEPEQPRCAPEPPTQNERRDCGRAVNSAAPGGFMQRLTSDRDSLLIIGLIVLLLHEKADMKLIAALAFILLT